VADAGAFLARLTRLDPAALVRLRSAPVPGMGGTAGRTLLWARLPWAVLVTRTVPGSGPGDVTVSAAELLAELARAGAGLPVRRDAEWRWPLPPSAGRVVETLSGAELRHIAEAAAEALRSAAEHGVAGRAVGQRALRDALLDHVAVVVTERPAGVHEVSAGVPAVPAGVEVPAGVPEVSAGVPGAAADKGRIEVSQRLVQAVIRMGFLGPDGASDDDDRVQVRRAGRWIGLSAPYGIAWSLKVSQLALTPTRHHPNG
jgi:hypothetical protein